MAWATLAFFSIKRERFKRHGLHATLRICFHRGKNVNTLPRSFTSYVIYLLVFPRTCNNDGEFSLQFLGHVITEEGKDHGWVQTSTCICTYVGAAFLLTRKSLCLLLSEYSSAKCDWNRWAREGLMSQRAIHRSQGLSGYQIDLRNIDRKIVCARSTPGLRPRHDHAGDVSGTEWDVQTHDIQCM